MRHADARTPLPAQLPKEALGERGREENIWSSRYHWLESCGYKLRDHFSPDWVPSRKTSGNLTDCEDGQKSPNATLVNATRVSNGASVSLKMVDKALHPHEAAITRFFSSEPQASDPRNHCVPVYETIQVPDDGNALVLCMPLLCSYDDPPFDTVGEVVDLFGQLIEGLHFMHQHHVAHRNIIEDNIKMDAAPLYDTPYHPAKNATKRARSVSSRASTRTQHPVRYYFTDFGMSHPYEPEECPPLEDPFVKDICMLGKFIRARFLHDKRVFDFMESLVSYMVMDNPTIRPTMDEVVRRFDVIRGSLDGWKLRSRVVCNDDNPLLAPNRVVAHWWRKIGFALRGVPAIPAVAPRA
ncbi:hypothetical protein PLICRDRAFT_103289 [Plicaturopsis crispa FD-325 SS-3]|nr:hypothetical protein PLICRDRAFT_103289 [Plicaturopsis crispa FD-325 SS-3]